MSLDPAKNFAKVSTSTGYDGAAVTIVLSAGDGAKLPQPSTDGAFNLVWWNSTDYGDPSDDPNKEIVRCTARTGDTLTVTRAQESTSAVVHNAAGKVQSMILAITKKMIDDLNTAIAAAGFKTTTGTINGVNTVFPFTSQPTIILTDIGVFANLPTYGFQYSAGNATLPIAPSLWVLGL